MSGDFARLSALKIAAGVRGRSFTAVAVVEALLARIESLNPRLAATWV